MAEIGLGWDSVRKSEVPDSRLVRDPRCKRFNCSAVITNAAPRFDGGETDPKAGSASRQ
jgi:hypothetical protein